MGTLHADVCMFIITSRRSFLRIRNFSDKTCGENRNTFYVHKVFFF